MYFFTDINYLIFSPYHVIIIPLIIGRNRLKIMNIYKSGEDYLETILILSQRNGNVRSVDIANELNFKKSSVSVAMKNLRLNDYIKVDENGYITLTESGLSIARKIYERHTILTDFLISIGVDKDVAAEDACKIEHDLSSETFAALKEFISNHPA